jgi:hypothetical protein
MVRLRGRCPRGERLIGYAPQGHWKILTLVAGLRQRAMVATCRAQYDAHAQKANDGANSSAPSLATRIRSWFN